MHYLEYTLLPSIIPGLKVAVNLLFAQFAIAMRLIRCALFRIHLITAVKQAETWHFIKELRTIISYT